MFRQFAVIAVAGCGWLGLAAQGQAQSTGMFNSRATSASGSSSYSSGTSLTSPSMGGSSMGGMGGTGVGGMGMNGMGMGGTGLGGAGAGRGLGPTGGTGNFNGPQMNGMNGNMTAGQGVGQNGFIGRSPNQGFVGNRMAGQNGQGQNFNQGMRGNRGNNNNNELNQLMQQQNQQNQGRNNRGRRALPVVHPQQRIAFPHPEPTPIGLQTTLKTQLDKLSSRTPVLSGVDLAVAPNNVVVLKGEVETTESRRLAEMFVRLEPGVRTVRNELTVRNP